MSNDPSFHQLDVVFAAILEGFGFGDVGGG